MSEIKTTFQLMLEKFNSIVDKQPPVSEVKERLEKLSEVAKNHTDLNGRQREAITDRVKYYLNGQYGKNSKKEAYQAPS